MKIGFVVISKVALSPRFFKYLTDRQMTTTEIFIAVVLGAFLGWLGGHVLGYAYKGWKNRKRND